MLQPVASDDSVDLGRLFVLLSCHLTELAQNAEDIETTLSSIIDEGATVDAERMKTLQKLDYLRQALEDCGALVDALSAGADVSRDDLERNIKLGVTRNLLSDGTDHESPEAGMPDLF